MTTIHPDNRGGTQILALWVNPADWAQCTRCGVLRRIRADRASALCRDCRTVEYHAARIKTAEPAEGVWVCRRGVRVLVPPTDRKAAV